MHLIITTMFTWYFGKLLLEFSIVKDLTNRRNGKINDKNHRYQYFQTFLRCMICMKFAPHQSIPQLEN